MKKKLKILIAEDDSASEMLTTIRVKEYAKKILIAKNGCEAVEIFMKNQDIDLIFMDIQMPVMCGYDAILEIRKLNTEVIIIVQTASNSDKILSIESGANDYLSKPSTTIHVKSLIKKYFPKS
jgi:CheY-like chemotaxis protein